MALIDSLIQGAEREETAIAYFCHIPILCLSIMVILQGKESFEAIIKFEC